ncbi:hypothetical protein J41TS8_15390 [Bacillus sp. J41TS8]|nr:hypothetical protein LI6934_07755 [Bacillus licheniformis LMG 6934]GIN76498.1 hypothetical protein J41TS8_15390 [Bacillus sp. J41TS8]
MLSEGSRRKAPPSFGRKAIETDAEESVWDCWRQRWSAMPLKRLNQSGLVPLKRVKLEK